MSEGSPIDISVIVCTHNGASRLPDTLRHLAVQKLREPLQWEFLIIDNASTDGTAETALKLWPADATAQFRIIPEPRLGISNARQRGIAESRGDLICFVDDDNWLAPDWLQIACDTMDAHPQVGALAGINEPMCAIDPPWWFEEFREVLATTPKDAPLGDLSENGWTLVTAGMVVRRRAWESLENRGFRITIESRAGKGLLAGEDAEICLALRLGGWHLYREPRMRLKHYLPANRLDWWYVRKLYRGYGQGSVQLHGYFTFYGSLEHTWKNAFRSTWQWHFLAAVAELLRYPGRLIRFPFFAMEGDRVVCEMEIVYGRALGLWRYRKFFDQIGQRVRTMFSDVHEAAARTRNS
jgi:glycosyltransferase involved in cell wall biosynthesis